jgi:hypothetical protein
MASAPQSYNNHAKFVPPFHGGVLIILLLNVGWSGWRLFQLRDMDHVVGLLMAIALFLLAFYARTFALTVQDRVIRLEMRLRLRDVLPTAMHADIPRFTLAQLVAMRFASDAELPDLATRVLRDGITERKAIKLMIQTWEADHLRA